MATKGYNSYHGRGNVKKILGAVALVLVILGAVGFLVAQNYIVYDDAGQAHLELPNRPVKKPEPEKQELPEDQIHIEYVTPEEQLQPVEALYAWQLPVGTLKQNPAEVLKGAFEAAAVDVKLLNGTIAYETSVEVPKEVKVEKEKTMANLQELLADERYMIAHMATLCDSYFVRAHHEAAFLQDNGGFWYDGDGWTWLNPTDPNVLGYITALCKEYAELGFDEILLDYFSYPTTGRLDRCVVEGGTDRVAVLQSFAESLRSVLPEDMVLSIVIRSDVTAEYGLSPEMIEACFDRVYIAPNVDVSALLDALPEDYDRETRTVYMTATPPESGSYLLTR